MELKKRLVKKRNCNNIKTLAQLRRDKIKNEKKEKKDIFENVEKLLQKIKELFVEISRKKAIFIPNRSKRYTPNGFQ